MRINRVFVRYLAYSLEIILLWVLQSSPKLFPELWGTKPFFLLALAMSIAACEDVIPSLVFGAVCGALADLSASGGVGFFAAAVALACFGAASLTSTYLNRNFFTFIVLTVAASVAVTGLYFLLFRLAAGVPDSGALFLTRYPARMGLTAAAAVPLYFLNRFLSKSLTAAQR